MTRSDPTAMEQWLALENGERVLVRPVQADDETLFAQFFEHVTPEDSRLRFFASCKIDHAFIARLVQFDHARAMAFIALDETCRHMLGVVRLHIDAQNVEGEYAILLRSDFKGHGLGWQLMQLIIKYARSLGLDRIQGQIMRENLAMLLMCQELGFVVTADKGDHSLYAVTLALKPMETPL